MSKSLTMLLRVACVLALVAQPLHEAAARPSSSSSHSSPHSSSSSHSSSSGSSKSFSNGFSSRRSSSAPASAPSGATSAGGFGSFGKRAPAAAPQRSDSAVSQQLTKQQAEANALRTLDARRSMSQYGGAPPARNDTDRAAQPTPMPAPAPSYGGGQAPNQTVVVRQDSGIGNLVTGYVLGRMASHNNNGHARPGYNNQAGANNANGTGGTSFFGSLLRLLLWAGVAALLVWGAVAVVRRVRRRREENKPNYSFQRRG